MDLQENVASLFLLALEGVPREGERSGQVSALARETRRLPESFLPPPRALALWQHAIRARIDALPARSVTAQAWESLEKVLQERWPLWSPSHPWGWHALSLSARLGDYATVSRLLAMEGAPAAPELSSRFLPAFAKDPSNGAKLDPKEACTLLGVIVQRAELASLDLLTSLLASGVDPNLPCNSAGATPLIRAPGYHHIEKLLAAGATFQAQGQAPLSWLDPSQGTRHEAIRAFDAQMNVWVDLLHKDNSQALKEQIKTHLPDLTDQAMEFFSRRPQQAPGQGIFLFPARQLHFIAWHAGVDIARPGPKEPGLLGAFARGVLRSICAHASPQTPSSHFPRPDAPLDFLVEGSFPDRFVWQGEAGGRPASVWGYLACAALDQDCPPDPEVFVESHPIPSAWWDEVKEAVHEVGSLRPGRSHAQATWRMLANLAPALSRFGLLGEWLPLYRRELDWMVGLQRQDNGTAPLLPDFRWKDWAGLLQELAKGIQSSERFQGAEEAAHLVLECAVVRGVVHQPPFLGLIQNLGVDLDIQRLQEARTRVSQPPRKSEVHQWEAFWMGVDLPLARAVTRSPRL